MSRTSGMVRLASRAIQYMEDSDVADVGRFLRSRIGTDGGFRGRAEASDLYYTLFGGACLTALQIPPPPGPVRRYLKTFGDGAGLDFIHAATLARCWAALPYPFSTQRGRRLLPRIEAYRAADGGYNPAAPGTVHGTVYGGFLAFLVYQESGATLPCPQALLASLAALRAADGGYANDPGLPISTTTATAAAILLQQWLARAGDQQAVAALQLCERPAGGFAASACAPGPDLLSTATALYALHASAARPAYVEKHLDFVESLWDAGGGFRGHPHDPLADCEYTFYALLALGCLHDT